MLPVANMVGSQRIVPVSSIVHPLGNPDLDPDQEKELRRGVVARALEALKKES